jgi:hypothetical protein
MSLQARSGDMAAFKTDVDQAVITKAGQLDGTAALLRRDPQPPPPRTSRPARCSRSSCAVTTSP